MRGLSPDAAGSSDEIRWCDGGRSETLGGRMRVKHPGVALLPLAVSGAVPSTQYWRFFVSESASVSTRRLSRSGMSSLVMPGSSSVLRASGSLPSALRRLRGGGGLGRGRHEGELPVGEIGLRELVPLGIHGFLERVVGRLFLAPFLEVEREFLLGLLDPEAVDALAQVGKLLQVGLARVAGVAQRPSTRGASGWPSNTVAGISSQIRAWGRSDSPIGRYSSTEGRTMSGVTPRFWVEAPLGR